MRTRYGVVLGASRPDSIVFPDVPYAAEPVGSLRFAPPAPPKRWNGVWPLGSPSAGSPDPQMQVATACADYFLGERLDNHLTLRISTPTLENARLPVIVWFHSGGFISGSAYAPANAGPAYARDGVVHVAVGFRQGIEGYFPFDGAEASGALNLGLQDQIAALEWLREEIAHFGGDPDRITVGGYGSGGTSVAYLLGAERARGLFSSAVVLSGAPRLVLTPELGTELADLVAAKLGARPTAERLRSLDQSAVTSLETAVRAHVHRHPDDWGLQSLLGTPFAGVVGGTDLPLSPLDALAEGATAPVPLFLGCSTNELAASVLQSDDGRVLSANSRVFPDVRIDEALRSTYRDHGHEDADELELFTAIATDYWFRLPALEYAERHRAPTWLYQFDWRNHAVEESAPTLSGFDIPLWTDDLDRALEFPELAELYGPEPPRHLVEPMHTALVRFVSGRDPGWAPYDTEERMTMCFDDIAVPVPDLHSATREAWERASVRRR